MMTHPAPPPHIHTSPIHPPSYAYPFLPHHAPRQPLEVRVEENAFGPGMERGSWVISVRLPGFAPDGITVGHFERRISFGYDADVAAIRAEFNGDLLRVTVSRRWILGPMGTIGRSTTIGHGPGPGTGTRPAVEQPSNKPLVDTSASGSAESTRLPGMS
ncbi:hypothetical protein RhiXN_10132 [Rhizoctonia solani]|uniref:SHSP domain-containing protein n=1 Tax=Rhizoctonia solani TaxID=456999 RepID=A0A8H8P362_9AGAM|nr:uncharacterized protein RhiXN_10132 [Rhizoctonia solani]QRW23808.1 hypothetical protein RhiXN_10132 [Rhizoctonia solani]